MPCIWVYHAWSMKFLIKEQRLYSNNGQRALLRVFVLHKSVTSKCYIKMLHKIVTKHISRLQTNYSNYNQQYSKTSIYPRPIYRNFNLAQIFRKKNQFGPNESNFLSYKHVTLCNYVMRFELVFPASIKRQFWGKEWCTVN